jgi:hypothetical protein
MGKGDSKKEKDGIWRDISADMSRRGYRHRQTEFHEGEVILIKRSWREEIKRTFDYDPLICPKCKIKMVEKQVSKK